MTFIKKIINWFINLFRKLFGKKKIGKKIKYSLNKQSNKHYFKEYGLNNDSINDSFPIYQMINEKDKVELIKKVELLKSIVENNNIDKKIIENINKEIKSNKISFYQNELINEKLDSIIDDKKIEIDTNNKIITLDKEVTEIIENYDKNIKEKTKKEYDVVNYITLTTLLLDETDTEIKKLEEDFHHHKHNKYHYERELKKIKIRIENLRKLRENESVLYEIELLKKDAYIKKKDKYDLLYNDEVFKSFTKNCDDLLKKVNRRIIDLKKEKEEEKLREREKEEKIKKQKKEEKDKLKEEKECLENILKRFQDMELARKILLLQKNEEKEIINQDNINYKISNIYLDFISGEKFKFNYNRNKTKLELVKLLNNLGEINSYFNDLEFIPFEHINYQLSDLVDLAIQEKTDLDEVMKVRFAYQKEKDELNILTDNKLNIIKEKELDNKGRQYVYVNKNEK